MTQLHAESRLDSPDPAPAPTGAPAPPINPPVAASPDRGPHHKNPLLAAFLSLFPGMGNIYNGLYMRGLTLFLIIAGTLGVLAESHGGPIFALALAFFWMFNILDAYRQAKLINYGYAQDLGVYDLPKSPSAAQGGVVGGTILLVIGLIAALDQVFRIDLSWLVDLWPFALVIVGAWMIFASLKAKREAARRDSEI